MTEDLSFPAGRTARGSLANYRGRRSPVPATARPGDGASRFRGSSAHSVSEGIDLIRAQAPAFAVVDMRLGKTAMASTSSPN